MSLSNDDVVEILKLLDASDFDELRLETNAYTLHVRRSAPLPGANGSETAGFAAPAFERTASASPVSPAANTAAAPPPTTAPPASVAPPSPASSPAVSAAASAANAALVDVKTPLLGTFYRRPQPGAPPFVEVGSVVEVDSVIGIVEVMKLMSSVSAGVSGVVAEIAATDGALVEYGEILMRIAPRAA